MKPWEHVTVKAKLIGPADLERLPWRNDIFHDSEGQTGISFPGGSGVKNPPAKQEPQVQSLGREDLLEKEMATYSSILACEIPWTEEPGGLQPLRSQRVGRDWLNNNNNEKRRSQGNLSEGRGDIFDV